MNEKFSLEAAEKKAWAIISQIKLHTERIAIAGSIRRGKPWVKDIDLVVIPKMQSKTALFGATSALSRTDFYEAVGNNLLSLTSEGTKLLRGEVPTEWPKKITVDIYIATEESWATLLLIRTGSAEHNIWMCARARACGGKLHADGSGLEVSGQVDFRSGFASTNPESPAAAQRTINNRVIRAKTEEEIFKALGIPLAEPKDRECTNGRPVWMTRGATA
jgi:DNA polymerase/3'-5' exonuclease PolX